MRLTFLIPANDLSGGVRVAVTYAQQMQARGHEVLVVYPRPQRLLGQWAASRWRTARKGPPTCLDRAGVPHREIDAHRPITDADLPDADVVIATWLHCVEWMAALAPAKGVKVHLVQGDDRDSLRFDGALVSRVEATWRLTIPKIAVSEWVARTIRDVVPTADIKVISNGVDPELFNSPPRARQPVPRVGFVYTTARCKGTDIAIAAIHAARRRLSTLAVTAFGADAPTPEMALPPETEFVQRPPQECLRDLYGKCDAWLFASRAEGFGLPILEAMACRTPVIATPAGAAPELLVEGGGILVEPESPASIADAIVRMAAMPQIDWQVLSNRAHATAQRRSWARAVEHFEQAILRAAPQPTQLTI